MNSKQQFIELGWVLLEHKCRYYYFNSPIIQDYEYDMLEREYEQLARDLGEEPTATNMVDFDEKRPSCQAVLLKLRGYKMS
jgi:NAD-dependent DNA ligase